jgi:hypothetical protein
MAPKGYLLRFSLAALAASRLFAQTSSSIDEIKPLQNSTSTIKVETRVVLLDVVVTDHKGESFANLRREDFQVAEDGKPQAISAFDEHKRETSASLDLPALPPNVYTNTQRLRSADAVNFL